jgi:hypothetical protein
MKSVLLALSLAACSCSHQVPPASSEDPRAEIGRLQQRIDVLRDSPQMEGAPDAERCRKMGAVADEICHCADRICTLAETLAEDRARLACAQAQDDCARSRANSRACLTVRP